MRTGAVPVATLLLLVTLAIEVSDKKIMWAGGTQLSEKYFAKTFSDESSSYGISLFPMLYPLPRDF